MPQNITVHIYDTDIRVTVPQEQEEAWRAAGVLVNDRINAYAARYKGMKSDKEINYYAMIDIALRLVGEQKRNDTTAYVDTIGTLTKEIEQILNNKHQ